MSGDLGEFVEKKIVAKLMVKATQLDFLIKFVKGVRYFYESSISCFPRRCLVKLLRASSGVI